MVQELDLRKKKLMSIVIMVIIMLLTLILMITTFTLEYMFGSQWGSNNNYVDSDDSEEVDALGVLMLPERVNLHVTNADLSKANVGNLNYISINGEEGTAVVGLKSNADTTSCNYNIIFNTEYNQFENKYILSNGTLGTLKNQLILHLDGYDMSNKNKEPISHTFDLIDIKNNDTILLENLTIIDNEDNKTTNIEWKINLSFRNYRDYDQANNGGKSIKGNLKIEFGECERTK